MAPAPPTATASTRRHRSRGSTPGRKSSKPKQSASNGNGLLSGVFSFVTQELSNFVAGATGRDEYEDEDVEYSGSPSQSSSSENEAETPTQSQASSRRKRSPSPRSPAHRPKRPRSSSKESKTKEHTRAAQAELDPYPTPRPILKAALDETASGSTSMPGALFPFSPASIFNDDGSNDESAPRSTRRRVHFDGKSDAGSSSHLVPISNVIEDEERDEDSAGPSTPHKKRTRRLSPSTPTRTPRTPPSSTIQAAVSKFRDADADASILLPSPFHGQLCPSPVRQHTPTMSEKAKGKQAARITSQVEPDPFDFEQDLSSGTTPSKTTGRERFTEDYLSGVSPEESFTTTHLKEQISQTTAAIERTSSSHSGSDVDKNRIRELEQEVQRLREELARRPSTINAPPPPPPPPPPNGLRIPLPSSLDPSTDASTLFLSARAALKHSGTPKEKPIISRPGLGPAVGIGPLGPSGGLGPDKMAAFLSEMKNVRLRKVGEKSFMNSERSFVSEGDVTRKEDANTSLSRSLLSKSWSGRAEGSRNQVRAGKPAAQETSNRLPDNTTAGDTNRMQDVGSKRKRSIEDVDQGRTEVDAISSRPLKRLALSDLTSSAEGATTLDPSTSMDTDNADLSFLSAPSLSVSTSRRHREQREQRRQREREQEARDREGAQTQLPSRGLSASIDSTVSASSSLLASHFGSDSTSSRLAVSTTPASAPPRRIVRDSNGIIRDWRTSTQAVPARVSPNEGSAAAHEEQQGRDLRTLHLEDLQAPTPSLCSDQDGDSHESHEDANQPRTPPQISPTSDSTSVARPFSGSGQLGGNGDDDHHGDLRLEFPDESRRYGAAIEESLLNEESFTYQVKLRVDSDDEEGQGQGGHASMFEGQYDQDRDDEDEEADRERGQGHEGDTEGDEPSENRHLAPPLFQNRQPTSPLPEPSPRRPRPPSLARASPRPFASFGSRSASLPTSRRLRSPPPPPLTHDQDDEYEAEDTDEPLVRSLSFQPKVPDRASKTAPASSSAATSALRSVKPLPTSRIPFPLTNQSAPGSASNTASVSVPVPPRRPTSSTSSLADKAQSKIPVPTRTRKVSGTPHPIKSRRNNQTSGEREESSKNISTSMPRSSSSHLSLRGTSRGNDLVGNASKENAKPVNKRRLTLDEELRNALPLPLSKEDLEDIEDADVYSGLGSMEPRGFFAHGGAGGLGVWIGPGHEVTERLSR